MDLLDYCSIKRVGKHYVLYISYKDRHGFLRVEEEIAYSIEDAISYLKKNFIMDSAAVPEYLKEGASHGFIA